MIWKIEGNKKPVKAELGDVIFSGTLEEMRKIAGNQPREKAKICKHWTTEMLTAHALMEGIYTLTVSGGAAHIVTDDGNIRDSDLDFCLQLCEREPDRPEAQLVKLFCETMKKLTLIQRTIVVEFAGDFFYCYPIECLGSDKCEDCKFVQTAEYKEEIYGN